MQLTLEKYIHGVENKIFSSAEIVQHYTEKAKYEELNAYVRLHPEYVADHQQLFSERRLRAAPIAIKDIILTEGYETTIGSNMMRGYIPPYSATCFQKLEQAGGLMLGKANMDEFAMGTSNESSAFGAVKNPYDTQRIAGGSSGGSAAAVAADLCLGSLGTDTGGSVRMPAALCGIVGVKPTYGRVSRYGVQALASSLDQVGVLAKTVTDARILLSAISGYDPADATSIQRNDTSDWSQRSNDNTLAGLRIAVPQQFFAQGIDEDLKQVCLNLLQKIEQAGAIIDWIDLPILEYGVATYYVIQPAEASTNLARFDGVRYGLQSDTMEFDSLFDYYKHIREHGFGEEVERRILTGTFVLSAGFYESYYRKAQQVRSKIQSDLAELYTQYDVVIGPTSPVPAWLLGEKIDDPIAMYLADVYTVIANLAGLPALSLPCGYVDRDGSTLPVGIQLMGPARSEGALLAISEEIEQLLGPAVNPYIS